MGCQAGCEFKLRVWDSALLFGEGKSMPLVHDVSEKLHMRLSFPWTSGWGGKYTEKVVP